MRNLSGSYKLGSKRNKFGQEEQGKSRESSRNRFPDLEKDQDDGEGNDSARCRGMVKMIQQHTGWVPKVFRNNISKNLTGYLEKQNRGNRSQRVGGEITEANTLSHNVKDIKRFRNFYFMYTHKRGKLINDYNKKAKTGRD